MTLSSNSNFYQNLLPFADFKSIASEDIFHKAPNDWIVVVSDVVGSTKAIEKGKYRDVNTIGVASIVSAHNALGDLEFPYVFGGDGSTFLAPASHREKIEKELKGLKEIAKRGFGLELRIAIITVEEVTSTNTSIEVAKFKLAGKKAVAIFRGGGLALAEEKIKTDISRYAIVGNAKQMVDLRNLSCRWNAIPAKRGKNLSLLVSIRAKNNMAIVGDILKKLENIYDGKLDDANPVNFDQMTYKTFTESFKIEKRLHTSIWSIAFIKRIISIFISVLMFKVGLTKNLFDTKEYTSNMGTHSDYRKFDDMLRMNLDCSPKQIDQITVYLKQLHGKNLIYYGLHQSNSSLMTCFVNGLGSGEHIHFIDGDKGGYAMAAKNLKKQMA